MDAIAAAQDSHLFVLWLPFEKSEWRFIVENY